MNLLSMYTFLATMGPLGYLTAPGTVASIATIPLVFWLRSIFTTQRLYSEIIVVIVLFSFFIIKKALEYFKRQDDPPEIVIDELAGCLITFLGIPLFPVSVLIGLLLFRFFDILKIGWVGRAEQLHGAWGILLDDIVAGLLSNILLRIMFN